MSSGKSLAARLPWVISEIAPFRAFCATSKQHHLSKGGPARALWGPGYMRCNDSSDSDVTGRPRPGPGAPRTKRAAAVPHPDTVVTFRHG
jgi:hypothetical protein